MAVPQVCLDAGDAVELGEMLEFLGGWLLSDPARLAESLRGFVGVDGYDLDDLRRDLSRFAFLLGFTDGEVLFGGDGR